MSSQWQENFLNVQNYALTSSWRRNINSDCQGHDLHDPKDCSIALDSCRTAQSRLMEVATVTHDIDCHKATKKSRRRKYTEATHSYLIVGASLSARTDSTGGSTHDTAHVCLARELVTMGTINDGATDWPHVE